MDLKDFPLTFSGISNGDPQLEPASQVTLRSSLTLNSTTFDDPTQANGPNRIPPPLMCC